MQNIGFFTDSRVVKGYLTILPDVSIPMLVTEKQSFIGALD